MEIQIRAAFLGASKREKDGKTYATIHAAVPMRASADALGSEAREFSMDGKLFEQCRKLSQGSALTLICDQFEWTKEGHTTTRQSVIGIEAAK